MGTEFIPLRRGVCRSSELRLRNTLGAAGLRGKGEVFSASQSVATSSSVLVLQERFHNDEAYQAEISGSDLLHGKATWDVFLLGEASVLFLSFRSVPASPGSAAEGCGCSSCTFASLERNDFRGLKAAEGCWKVNTKQKAQ